MIAENRVKELVEEVLSDSMFIVDITVNERNVINVFVDSFDGITIEQCIAISRHVEHSFNRDEEDFELHVSSPGLTQSFRVKQQYEKYISRGVEVKTTAGEKLEGVLLEAGPEKIVVETSSRKKVEGHKKKQLVVKQHQIKYDEIESAKAVISFK